MDKRKNKTYTICKNCFSNKYTKNPKYILKKKEYASTYTRKTLYISKKEYPNNNKTCNNCKLEKKLENFHFDNSRKAYKSECKMCISNKHKLYRKNNKDKITDIKKKPENRIKQSFYSRLNIIFKGKTKQSKLLSKYLGCSPESYISWIKYQFSLGMTIDNYGTEWHIDHVKPCSSYDLSNEEQIKDCMSWKNLRPCWKRDNLEKSDKVDINLINEHSIIVEKYLAESLKHVNN